MLAYKEILNCQVGTSTFSKEARYRILATLDRLTGGKENRRQCRSVDIEKAQPAIEGLADSQFTAFSND